MQLGPITVTPSAAAVAASSSSACRPWSPVSEKPAAMTTAAGTPRRPHCSSTAPTWRPPTASSAVSYTHLTLPTIYSV